MNNASARIDPVTEPNGDVADTLAKSVVPGTGGAPLNIFRTLAHHPRLLRRFNALGGVFMAHGLLPARLREVVILRTAWITRSEYEWGQHVLIGRRAGLDDAAIRKLMVETPAEHDWESDERLAISITDELLASVTISDGLWRRAAEIWSDAELLELVALVGFYRMTAGLLNGVRVEQEAALPGWDF